MNSNRSPEEHAEMPTAAAAPDLGSSFASGKAHAAISKTVVDSTGVTVITFGEVEGRLGRPREKLINLGLVLYLAIVVGVFVVSVAFFKSRYTAPSPPSTANTEGWTTSPTLAPTSVDLPKLVSSLEPFSGTEVFQDRSSAQFQAARWLANEDSFIQGKDDVSAKFYQRYALAVFYFALGGGSWNVCYRGDLKCDNTRFGFWLSDRDECNWLGVSCNDNGLVTHLDFGELFLSLVFPRFKSTLTVKNVLPSQ
jgi:hypothetical protein